MLTDPLQNIDEVGVRIDTLQLAGNQQALDHAYPPSAQLRPRSNVEFNIMRETLSDS